MSDSRKLNISVGDNRFSQDIQKKTVTWEVLSTRLLDIRRTPETYDEYLSMSPAQQAAIKDQGFFVGGRFSGSRKRISELIARSAVALDIDHLRKPKKVAKTYSEYEYVLHSTHKHCNEKPRLRLVFPLTKDVTPDQYEPLARKIAEDMGLDYFDDTTFQAARIMFWGTASKDADIIAEHNKAKWIDPDEYLDTYEDWKDTTSWPVSKREGTIKHRHKEAADPLSAPGVIGAFNRVFDIHSAIETYDLPYEVVSGSRYRYATSTGGPGVVIYDDIFLYSHHESDPAYGNIRNAFDLVRINLFGEDKDDSVPVLKRPSMISMTELALRNDDVCKELAQDEFEPLDDEETPAKKKRDLSYSGLSSELSALIEPSPDQLNAILKAMAASRELSAVEEDMLRQEIHKLWPAPKPGLVSLKKTLRDIRASLAPEKRGRDDVERLLIERYLDKYHEGGRFLKRIQGQWWQYKGGVWKRLEVEESLQGGMIECIMNLKEEYPEDAKVLADEMESNKTSATAGQVWKMFCALMATKETADDPLGLHELYMDPVVNCQNGEIHYDESGLYEFIPHDYRHHQTHQLGVDYDPDAECPHWDQFMDLITSEMDEPEAVQQYLYELCGYLIQPNRSLKLWVLMHGEGYNGKSTIGSVLGAMLGKSVEPAELDAYGGDNTHATSSLVGKLLMLEDDYTQGKVLPDGLLKKLSEAKMITANPKFTPQFSFISRAVPVILANHWPTTRDTSLALRERAQVIDLNHYITPAERDSKAQATVIKDELSGILNHFIEGYARLKLRGNFDPPAECERAKDRWVQMSNPVAMWASECTRKDDGGFISRAEAWASFSAWSSASNPHGGRIKKVLFHEKLAALWRVSSTKRRGIIGYPGYLPYEEEFDE